MLKKSYFQQTSLIDKIRLLFVRPILSVDVNANGDMFYVVSKNIDGRIYYIKSGSNINDIRRNSFKKVFISE